VPVRENLRLVPFDCSIEQMRGNLNYVGVFMTRPRKSLAKTRSIAFSNQSGYCFYCSQPMWSENPLEFASKHKITLGQAKRFQCTGEHLKAHHEGGSVTQTNIVAACWFCNQKRHKRKEALPPDQYKQLIHQRMSQGRWHNVRLIKA
jgi:5-methylcytosine-specific restriction endonuclease McrA